MKLFRLFDRKSKPKKKSTSSFRRERYKGKFAAEVVNTRHIIKTLCSSLFYTTLMIVLVLVMLWFCRQISDKQRFSIRHIEWVTPSVHISLETREKIISPWLDKNFFTANIVALKQRLNTLPWVHEVVVSRTWPDGLSVYLREQTPIARLTDNQLLNSEFEIFTVPYETLPKNLPQLRGPIGQLPIMWQNYQSISAILQPIGLSVAYLELSDRQILKLKLTNGLTLILDRLEGLDHLSRFVRVYHQLMTPQTIAMIDYIDLRYTNGMAVHAQTNTLSASGASLSATKPKV